MCAGCKGKKKNIIREDRSKMKWSDNESESIKDYELSSEVKIIEEIESSNYNYIHPDKTPISINDTGELIGFINSCRSKRMEEDDINIKLREIKDVTRVSYGGNPARITSVTFKGNIVKVA
jgi:hypothetical protein